ncbi:hypothetical protein CSB45_12305, partial [candidate division KSB3 bacterium]
MKYAACLLAFLLCCCLLYNPQPTYAKTEEEYQQEMRTLQKRNIQLENKLEQLTIDLKAARDQLERLQEQLATGEANAKEAKAARAALKDVKQQLKELLAQQSENGTAQHKKLQSRLEEALQEKQALEKELFSLKKSVSSDTRADLEKQVEHLQAELEKQKKLYKANLILLNEREQELQKARGNSARSSLSAELQKSEARATEFEATVNTLNSRLLILSEENKQLRQQVNAQRQTSQEAHAQVAELIKFRENAVLSEARAKELEQKNAELSSQLVEAHPGDFADAAPEGCAGTHSPAGHNQPSRTAGPGSTGGKTAHSGFDRRLAKASDAASAATDGSTGIPAIAAASPGGT